LKKFGAIVGDRAEVGCNSVLSPGSVLGRDAIVHPCVHWKGVLGEQCVAKLRQQIETGPRL
jgi:carbonic anhydrase/acetyltransferase-like protein (isoleucine patch superfamily)